MGAGLICGGSELLERGPCPLFSLVSTITNQRERRASMTASLLRLATALLIEIDDEWITGRRYLNMKSE